MPAYLITGVAGTGKSTVQAGLIKMGYKALDTDDYAHWVERSTGKPFVSRPHSENWAGRYDWGLKDETLEQLIKTENKHIFICGITHDMDKLFPLFETIVLLDASEEVLTHRLRTRTNNRFGKRPDDIKQTLEWKPHYNNLALTNGAVLLTTDTEMRQTLDSVITLTIK